MAEQRAACPNTLADFSADHHDDADSVIAITLAVQDRIARILAAGPAQASQIRLELTELEARCRRQAIELAELRAMLPLLPYGAAWSIQSQATAADWANACDPLVICDEGPTFAELTDMATERGGPG